MKYFTYVLLSLFNGYLYIGSTEDVRNRVELHNKGRIKSTKAYKPWKLLEYYEFESRGESFKYERFLKTHQQKDLIKKRHGL